MIKPVCRKCSKELDEYGGLLISPPDMLGDSVGQVVKSHICVDCYKIITAFINRDENSQCECGTIGGYIVRDKLYCAHCYLERDLQ